MNSLIKYVYTYLHFNPISLYQYDYAEGRTLTIVRCTYLFFLTKHECPDGVYRRDGQNIQNDCQNESK